MAISPEVEKRLGVEEIPENPVIPEHEQDLQAIPYQHTHIPQVSDNPALQITSVPLPANPNGPSITLPADPIIFTRQAKGSTDDTTTWSAWFWLRMLKKAIAQRIRVLVKGENG